VYTSMCPCECEFRIRVLCIACVSVLFVCECVCAVCVCVCECVCVCVLFVCECVCTVRVCAVCACAVCVLCVCVHAHTSCVRVEKWFTPTSTVTPRERSSSCASNTHANANDALPINLDSFCGHARIGGRMHALVDVYHTWVTHARTKNGKHAHTACTHTERMHTHSMHAPTKHARTLYLCIRFLETLPLINSRCPIRVDLPASTCPITTYTHTLTHSQTHTLTHTHTHANTDTHTLILTNSHTLTHTHTHAHTHHIESTLLLVVFHRIE